MLYVVVVVVEVDEASPQLLHGKNSKKISLRKQKSSKRENFNKIFTFYRNRRGGWRLAAARPAGSLGFNRNYRNRSYRNRSYRNYQIYRNYRRGGLAGGWQAGKRAVGKAAGGRLLF